MQELFVKQMDSDTESLEFIGKRMQQTAKLSRVFADVDLSDVETYSAYDYLNNTCSITFHLKEEAKASRLPHVLAQRYNMKLEKAQGWQGKSLTYSGETFLDNGIKYSIVVAGAVPETCTVEYVEEIIPEAEVVRKRTKAVIRCPGVPVPEENTIGLG